MLWRKRLLSLGLVALGLLLGADTSSASHITGYDLSHSISSGITSFKYKVIHLNCLKYPGSACPYTGGISLDFGDGFSASADAEIVSPIGGCPSPCRIVYQDCTNPADASTCDTAITNRTYTHAYSGCGPFTAGTSDCCRISDIINLDAGSIDPQNLVTPCCLVNGQPNSGPSFSAQPVQNAFQNIRYLQPLGATDPEGQPLTLTFINVAGGFFFGCPFFPGCPTSVMAPNPLPLAAYDPCQLAPPPAAVMTITGDNLDWDLPISGASCNQTRLGSYAVGVKVTDSCGATAQREFLLKLNPPSTSNPNDPVLTVTGGPATLCINTDTAIFNLVGTDSDPGQIVNLSVSPSVFPGMTFTTAPGNPALATFTFAPTTGGSGLGTFGFSFIAQDNGSPIRTDQESISIEVIDCSNNPPVANPGGPYNIECNGEGTTSFQVDGSASSDPEGGALSYQWTTDCPGGVFANPLVAITTLALQSPPPCPINCTVTLQVTDPPGLSDTDAAPVSVDDTIAPTVTPTGTLDACYPDQASAEADAEANTAASDVCLTPTLATATVGTCAAAITVTAEDGCNSAAIVFNTRIDATAPVLTPGTINACYATQGDAEVACLTATTATDNCGDPVAKSPSTVGTCAATVTITGADTCSNAASINYGLRIDNTAPVLTAGTIDACYATRAAAEAAAVAATGASDNCGDPVPLVPATVGTCAATITVTGKDTCGNGTSVAYTTRIDGASPTIQLPAPITIECTEPGGVSSSDQRILDWLAQATAADNCGLQSFGNDAPTFFPAGCGTGVTTVVTFTAVDQCGLVTTETSSITVVDLTPPSLAGCDLEPWDPILGGPAEPAPASSAKSCASSGQFRVECGVAVDTCNSEPVTVSAEIIARKQVVTNGACVVEETIYPVACDEIVELQLLTPPCKGKQPKSPKPATSPTSPGIQVIAGETLLLRVTAKDGCNNVSAPCEVAPLLCAPDPAKCKGGLCPVIVTPAGRSRARR